MSAKARIHYGFGLFVFIGGSSLNKHLNGQRFETATTRFVEIRSWSQEAGKVLINSKEAKELNEFLSFEPRHLISRRK